MRIALLLCCLIVVPFAWAHGTDTKRPPPEKHDTYPGQTSVIPLPFCPAPLTDTPGPVDSIHVIYAYPREYRGNWQSRLDHWQETMEANVRSFTAFVGQQTDGQKTVRFDRTDRCGGRLDITRLPLKGNSKDYQDHYADRAASHLGPKHIVKRRIRHGERKGKFRRVVKRYSLHRQVKERIARDREAHHYLVVVDGLNLLYQPNGDYRRGYRGYPQVDGEAWVDDDRDVRRNENDQPGGTAFLYLPNLPTHRIPRSILEPEMLAHEVFHTLGSVLQWAPHSLDHKTAGHCYGYGDLMCYDDGVSELLMKDGHHGPHYDPGAYHRLSREVPRCDPYEQGLDWERYEGVLDCGNDDYFNPDGKIIGRDGKPVWNTYRSRYLVNCALSLDPCAPITAP